MKLENVGDCFIEFGKGLKSLIRGYTKQPISVQITIWFLVVVFIYWWIGRRVREGFTSKHYGGLSSQSKSFVQLKGQDVYDSFYAELYDDLTFDENRHEYEISEITQTVGLGKESRVLDVGCGTGDTVNALQKKGIPCEGIDISPSMIQKAQMKYPALKKTSDLNNAENTNGSVVRVSNVLSPVSVPPHSLTHILCLFYTIYCIQDKQTFFSNAYEWLEPGGFLVVHMVNRNKFSPIIPAGDPFVMVNPQQYAKERITETSVVFKDVKYKAKFNLDKDHDEAVLEEQFKDDKNNKTRKQRHILSMPTQRSIVDIALTYGFTLKGKIDMTPCMYDNQYLYIFVK